MSGTAIATEFVIPSLYYEKLGTVEFEPVRDASVRVSLANDEKDEFQLCRTDESGSLALAGEPDADPNPLRVLATETGDFGFAPGAGAEGLHRDDAKVCVKRKLLSRDTPDGKDYYFLLPRIAKIRIAGFTPFTGDGDGLGLRGALAKLVNEEDGKFTLAYRHLAKTFPGDGPEVLYVLVAPEWYFKKTAGDYGQADVMELLGALKRESLRFRNALLVPGSIFWTVPKKDGGNLIYNTVLAACNGELVHMYHKLTEGGETSGRPGDVYGVDLPVSGAQGTIRWREVLGRVFRVKRRKSPEREVEVERTTNTTLFRLGGRLFGVEVCADHSAGILRGEYERRESGGPGVDFHMLVSCGQSVFNNNVYAKKGGFFFQCDGSNEKDESSKQFAFQVRKVADRRPGEQQVFVDLDDKNPRHPKNKEAWAGWRTYLVEAPRDERLFVWNDLLTLPTS
jgi:hypothetical protein